jgi:hypothetical protein
MSYNPSHGGRIVAFSYEKVRGFGVDFGLAIKRIVQFPVFPFYRSFEFFFHAF